MKRIDSDALGELNKALGLTGAGSRITELADGVVDQVIDIAAVARRGRTQADIQGIYTPTLRNENTAAETITTTIDPYNVGATAVVAPYPNPMPPQFDIWLIGASMRIAGGSATNLSVATLSLTVGTRSQGFGIDDSGAQVLVAQPIRLAFWDNRATDATVFGLLDGDRGPHKKIGLRLPRGGGGSRLNYITVSAGVVDSDVQLILGVFPAALGQDILV